MTPHPAIAAEPAFERFPALGSEIVVAVTPPDRLLGVAAHVRACVADVDRTLSRFRSDSELRRLEFRPGSWQPVSPLFLETLELAIQAAAETGGVFDPTVRDAIEAAGYDRSIEQLEATGPGPARPAAPAGRWREIGVDHARRAVLLPEGVRLDFGGIGKGFLVDLVLRDLAHAGVGVLVSAGGDLGVVGPAPEGGWACGIAVSSDDPTEATVVLERGALATSGLGRRQWRRDGQTLHHLIDPRTGRPAASPWLVVTAAAPTCVAAEVAAKVAWLLGDAGPDWIATHGLAARFHAMDGRIVTAGPWPADRED